MAKFKVISNNTAKDEKAPAYAGPHKPMPETKADSAMTHPADRIVQSGLAQTTLGISPISLALAFYDWAAHLALSPGKQSELQQEAIKNCLLRAVYISQHLQADKDEPDTLIEPKARDRRFDDPAWEEWPYSFYAQNFLLSEKWWDMASTNIHGVSRHHTDVVNFTLRQIMDVFSPSNFALTNPKVIQKTLDTGGQNFIRGAQNFIEDVGHSLSDQSVKPSEDYKVGEDVAVTKGKVVYRNRLIELIQYEPQTKKVYPQPLLIVPAWIMKYYILDLSPHNSLVRYLVEQGHTVFMISWKNPGVEDRDLGFEDYLNLGVLEAIKAIQNIVPDQKINATGYCLGGTLLMMAAAWLERQKDSPLNTISLFAAQVDFEEAGELMLFMDESQLSLLEDMMWQKGYLDQQKMSGAFNLLRSNDLIWSRMVNDYLMGERRPPIDLMSWNADTTRMPYKMHSEYLRSLYLNNALSEGHFQVKGQTVTLTDIQNPIFSVGTVKDHVAPWQSVYKLHLYTATDVTFVLTTGGHNAGIVSEPGHKGRSYQVCAYHKGDQYLPPERWQENAPRKDGSWWPEWAAWLKQESKVTKVDPPSMGNPDAGYRVLDDAPGRYVHMK